MDFHHDHNAGFICQCYGTVEHRKHSVSNHLIVTTVERTSDFLVKNHVLWAPMGFLDAGYPQVSGADQVIVSITSNLRVPIR